MIAQARARSRFELFSPYAPDECATRLDPRGFQRLKWVLVVSPVALLGFGGLLLHWGRVLAKGEADDLLSFIRMILDARTVRA